MRPELSPGDKLTLRYFPEPVLRRKARDVVLIDSEVRRRARAMLEIMYEHGGIGLAAPQVGWSERLFVANLTGDPEQTAEELVFVNPIVTATAGAVEETMEEGCLSFRELRVPVTRPATIHVRATDLEGKIFELEATELLARCVQHEVDHLDGILFIQRISMVEQLKIKRALKELEKDYAQR
ncbi:MAG: peptide deformylase [Planctomycetota bacterium]